MLGCRGHRSVEVHAHGYIRTILWARAVSCWGGMRWYHHRSGTATHGITYDWRWISRRPNGLVTWRTPHGRWVCLVLGIGGGRGGFWGFLGGRWLLLRLGLSLTVLLLLTAFSPSVFEPNLWIELNLSLIRYPSEEEKYKGFTNTRKISELQKYSDLRS